MYARYIPCRGNHVHVHPGAATSTSLAVSTRVVRFMSDSIASGNQHVKAFGSSLYTSQRCWNFLEDPRTARTAVV